MSEPAKLQFYEVTKCGFYKKRGKKSAFGEFQPVAQDLISWLRGCGHIGETATTDGEPDKPRILGLSADPVSVRHGDFVLSLWNEQETDKDGKRGAVRVSSPVGQANVHAVGHPAGTIPGVASHYWVLPSRNLVATITFDWQRVRVSAAKRYLRGFMATHSNYAVQRRVLKKHGAHTYIVGYRAVAADATRSDLYPRFDMARCRIAAKLKEIRAQRSNITQVVHRRESSTSYELDQSLLRQIFSRLHFPMANRLHSQPFTFRTQVDICPTKDELDAMIAAFTEEGGRELSLRGVNDVGFRIAGRMHWLSRALSQQQLELDVQTRGGVVTGQSLGQAIRLNRKSVLAEFRRQRGRKTR